MLDKKWRAVIILGFAQFVMVLDSTVMNVSISTIVDDLGTSVASMQTAITFYTLTMAALMLLGAKLGDVWGRKRVLVIGSIIYAVGSLITALSQNFLTLFIGWSVVEGIGAVLVIPAIAALIATNYSGKDRIKAYAMIGAVAGAAAAAGPLIGGFVTTYLSWRYVFIAEVVIMAGVLLFTRFIDEKSATTRTPSIDIKSVLLSSFGLICLVLGLLQSKVWGLIQPRSIPIIFGHEIAPLGISLSAYLILLGIAAIRVFFARQQQLSESGRDPLVDIGMLSIKQLRSGLGSLMSQYIIVGAVFFIVPVYLQMTLGLDALKTGIRIMPLSVALIIASVVGTRLTNKWSPKRIVRIGQYLLVFGVVLILGAVDITLGSVLFLAGMFVVGAGVGLMSSQLGNINMSAVKPSQSSEVGGLQGVFQNLGSSIGTAVIGSVLIGALTTSFMTNVQASTLPPEIKSYITANSETGVGIVSVSDVADYAKSSTSLSDEDAELVAQTYGQSQVEGLRQALFALFVVSFITLLFSRNLPNKLVK